MIKKTGFVLSLLFACVTLYAQSPAYKWGFPVFSRTMNSNSMDRIAVNDSDDVFAIGYSYYYADLDPSPYVDEAYNGSFIAKYSKDKKLIWSLKNNYGNLQFVINDIACHKSDYIYLLASFTGTLDVDFTPGTYTVVSSGASNNMDLVVLKYTTGGQFVWAKSLGGPGVETGYSIDVDDNGNCYIGSGFSSTIDVDPGPGVVNMSSQGQKDGLLLKLDAMGNYLWSVKIGAVPNDWISSVACTNTSVFVIGLGTNTIDFDPSASVYNVPGTFSQYIAKYDAAGAFESAGGYAGVSLVKVSVSPKKHLFVAGNFTGNQDIDPSTGIYNVNSGPSQSGFLSQLDTMLNFTSGYAASSSASGSFFAFTGLDVDSLDNAYLLGYENGTYDFDPSPGVSNVTNAGNTCFMACYNSANQLVFANSFPGTGISYDINVSKSSANFYLTAAYSGTVDLDPGPLSTNLDQGYGCACMSSYENCTPVVNSFSLSICRGQVFMLGTDSLKETGVYSKAIRRGGKCDSIVTVNLHVGKPDRSVTVTNGKLVSNAGSGTSFQWIDCSTNSAVGAATTASFTPPDNSGYRVKVTNSGCTDTSDCQQVFGSGNAGNPVLAWAYKNSDYRYYGLNNFIKTDNQGNFYVTGNFVSVCNMDLKGGVQSIGSFNDTEDIYISKYDNDGNFIWTIPVGSKVNANNGDEGGVSMAVDNQGYVYVTGFYQLTSDFDARIDNAFNVVANGSGVNTFIAKYSPMGELVWAKGIGAGNGMQPYSLAIDAAGNVIIGGIATGGFDPDPGPAVFPMPAQYDYGFVAKYSGSGAFINAIPFYTGIISSDDKVRAVTTDNNSNIIVTGEFRGTMDLNPQGTSTYVSSAVATDLSVFVCKYSPALQLKWGRGFGVPTNGVDCIAGDVAADASGNTYFMGQAVGSINFGGGNTGNYGDFLVKYDSTGVFKFKFPLSAGGGTSYVYDVVVDKEQQVYACGGFYSAVNMNGVNSISSLGATDGYLAKYNSVTGVYQWGMRLGSTGDDYAQGAAVDNEGNVFVAGHFEAALDFDPSASTYTLMPAGSMNYIAKYGQDCAPVNNASSAGSGYVTASAPNSYYVWKNCATNQVVASTTTNTFYPTSPGQYKAVIYQGNCVDSTICQTVNVITTGIEAKDETTIALYPVPATDYAYIDAGQNVVQVKLYDINGRLCCEGKNFDNRRHAQLSLSGLKEGVYMAEIMLEDHTVARRKLIRSGQ